MPRNGSGTYSLPAGNPVVTNTTISSTWANTTLSDLATGLTNSLSKDGQTTPTANLPMGGFKLTGLGTGNASTDSASLGQIQAQAYLYLGSVSGTDTITASTSPVTTGYAAGQTYRFVAANTNTGAVTININSLGAKNITKNGSTALVAGDIVQNALYQITYDGTQFQLSGALAADSITSAALADSALGGVMINGRITASVNANALTIAIKTNSGADPSSSSPVLVVFRNATVSNGSVSIVSITAATSVVVSNGSSLGTTASVAAKLNVLLLNNAGTAELAVCNAYSSIDLDEGNVISTTAEGGAGGADSASVIYSTSARTNVAFRYVGYLDVTPGASHAWSAAPTVIANASGTSANNMAGMLTQVQSISGASSYTFSIPAWAKKAICTFTGLSTNGTAAIIVRLGDAGGVENTGYNGTITTLNAASSANANISAAFNLTVGAVAAGSYSGRLELTLHNPYTNTWVAEGGLSRTDATTAYLVRGDKSTSAKATTIELSTADTFDGGVGEWAILFE